MRLAILTAVGIRLGEIRQSNGFQTDLGAEVTYWKDLPNEYGKGGALTWADTTTEITHANQVAIHAITIMITAVAYTSDPLSMSCAISADLLKAMGGESLKTFGQDLIASPISLSTEVETKGKTAVQVEAEFVLTYRTGRYEI